MARGLVAIMLAVGLLGSCGDGGEPAATTAPSSSATGGASASAKPSAFPAGDADISITSPDNGATVRGSKVTVETEVSDFELVNKIGKKATEGEGHIIFYMGTGYTVPTALGQPANSGGSGAFVSYPGATAKYTWENVPSGTVTFRVQLVNSDNTPLDPPQVEETTVTVQA